MRPAHFAREIVQKLPKDAVLQTTSMRPAHFAREIAKWKSGFGAARFNFNEARAFCAGNSGRRLK